MLGLKFRVEGIYFVSFRKPTTTALSLTYLLPPFTTIRGLIANALGLPRDSFEIQEWFKIGIKPDGRPQKNKEMAKFLKFIKRDKETRYLRTFPSSPVHREFLVRPSYWLYLVGEENKIKGIYKALSNPKRPLYLGTSDDLVDLEVFEPIKVEKTQSNEVHSILDGVYEGCLIENLPYRFVPVKDKRGNLKEVHLEYKLVSIPRAFPYVVENPIEVWDFDREFVRVI
ncbi:CRISPR-associated protein Cas5 [Thermococcus barophilus]|uniref:CRISPR-associated protein Cas5 n=1 Tax=Thermococcus barophilus TaxID=55802 RepID=A0A0S1XA79_THEBA|nr:CRISPR-associated protein Cas5 [Thermococcus barophilus]ALM74691.1 CRISPR-associated protein Cas5 [Thermococcus barophilus]